MVDMNKNHSLQIVVLGGGPAGLCAAWNLTLDGYKVTVLEKEAICGGQSITFRKGNYRYDLGPHNIHPQRRSIIDFLKQSLGDEFVMHDFFARIFFRNRWINYPFVGVDVLKAMRLTTTIGCAGSFLWAKFKAFLVPVMRDDGTFKTWIVNRFGRKFYSIYFGPYSEKVWCIPPDKLSDVVAKKRIVVTSLVDLIHSIIFKKQQYHPENPSTIENYYPQEGVGTISDFFVDGIVKNGGRIITEADVTQMTLKDGHVVKISYRKNGKIEYLEFERPEEGKVLSTIPLNEMILLLEGDVPLAVQSAAKGLDFTSEVFLYLNINKTHAFDVPLVYFSEPEFPFNRAYDLGIFSRKMVPENKNAVCLEISCNRNDAVWNMNDDAMFEKCMRPLEKYNLLHRSDVEAYHTRRLAHAYPRFRVGYQEKLNGVLNYIAQIPNLTSFGRQGLFSYANVDDVLWMGFEVAKNVHYGGRIQLSMKELLPQYISF
jgi:protoporphyrinogen oxidase